MRRIIFDRTGPQVHLSSNGQIIQLATGSDSFAEHNMPEYHLVPRLCNAIRYEGDQPTDEEILESLRVTKGELFQFAHVPVEEGAEPEAIFGYSRKNQITDAHVLNETCFQNDHIASALAMGNFAIRVRQQWLIDALAEFYEAVKAGHVVMAPGSNLTLCAEGLVLVNTKLLSDEEHWQLARDVVEHLRRHRQIHW